LGGTYTRMLHVVLIVSWMQHSTKAELYETIPTVSSLIRERRLRYAGHCFRSKDELISDILWNPRHGHRSAGRPKLTYTISRDTSMLPEDLRTAMLQRDVWKERVVLARATRPTSKWKYIYFDLY